MTMRVSSNRIDMDDKVLQKPVIKDYGETVVTDSAGVEDTGYHLSFDGINDYVDCGTGINVANASFSLAVWAKRTATGDYHYICGQGTSSNNNGMHIGFRNTDEFAFAFWGNDLDTSASYTDSDWHHWVCTYDASTNERIIYRDGGVVASDTASADFQGSGTFEIGRLEPNTSLGYDFVGSLDDFRFYSRVLSPVEANNLYVGMDISSTSLEGHWKFDNGSGSSATDSSGNGNTGTITGADWVAGDAKPPNTEYVVDLRDGNVFEVTMEGNVAFTFSNPPASGTAGNITIILHQDGTGGRLAVWPSAVRWFSGEAPTLSSGANKVDILTFSTIDGGSTWYGSLIGQYPVPPSVPGAPTSLVATAGDEEADLSWSTPASDGGSAITGYKIYRDTSSSATTLVDTIGVTTSYNDTGLTNDTTYYYRVKAVNGIGDSVYSNEDSVSPTNVVSDSISTSITSDSDDGVYAKGTWDNSFIVQGGGYGGSAGLRFRSGVNIPQGATITSATLSITRSSVSGSTFGNMYGYDADDPAVWSSSNHPVNMTKTTANVTITNNGSTTTMDVADIVQEIVNRGGWSSGNAMAFGGDTGGSGYIEWAEDSATLDVDFEYTI